MSIDELNVLRARVYGPDAHPDDESIRRLQELEAARRPQPSALVDEPAAREVPDPGLEPEVLPEPVEPREPVSRAVLRRVRSLRRSTVVILAAVFAFVVAVVVVLTLVQRVQTDPLQAGAQQVARLGVDTSFTVPLIFRGGPNGDIATQGFHEFHGLRAIVTEGGFFGTGADDPCLAVYPDAAIDDVEAGSFTGPLIGGCAVGGFPAIAQVSSGLAEFPEQLSDAFPGAGLQFVYDSVNNEVVVFAVE